jgi:AcrR family transcriptional regulator
VTEGGRTRRYSSPLREENARRTRQAITAAAHQLFTERGYGTTSLADIAAAAGVARPTPTAVFGSKPALLREVLDQALAGDDEPVSVAQRPWFRPVLEAASPAGVLDAYTAVIILISRRAARIYEVVRRAADDGGEAAELWETLQRNRRTGARMVIDRLAALGPLADGLDTERAADILSVLNDPALPDYLVRRCGWPEAFFAAWLSGQLRHALLPDATAQRA